MTRRLQQDLPRVLGLEVGVAPGGVGHEPAGGSARPKGQIGGGVGLWGAGGEVRGRGEVGHSGEGGLVLLLGLAAGVSGLELVLQAAALLAGGQIVKLVHDVKQ